MIYSKLLNEPGEQPKTPNIGLTSSTVSTDHTAIIFLKPPWHIFVNTFIHTVIENPLVLGTMLRTGDVVCVFNTVLALK